MQLQCRAYTEYIGLLTLLLMPAAVESFVTPGIVRYAANEQMRGHSETGFTGIKSRSPGARTFYRRRSTSAVFMEEIECDVAVIGGGPAGCTCALYTSRSKLKTVVLDKNPAVGALAITSTIANYPGVDRTMSGMALLDQMREQAIQYGTDYRRAQVFMVDLDGEDGMKTVYTPDVTVKARSLVLATGALGRSGPSYDGEDKYLGQGVSYCATCDGAFYQNSEVCVVGVNQEAVEEAQFLTKFASTVHWITSVDVKDDDTAAQYLLSCPNVKQWKKTKLVSVEGDVGGVTGVMIKETKEKEAVLLPVEGAFIYMGGSKPITDFLGGKVKLQDDGGVHVDEEMSTSVPGVYGIGDIRNTPFKQVVVAASDGCVAAMSIDRYLKEEKLFKSIGYTNKLIPGLRDALVVGGENIGE
eukprot:CAMPEP_0194282384 /NCGR_PEP_ID=MMETSP0169-20130528/22987_1 /TAXON_ID=218684 /ORGANISM="Corethron pennatum, Strain L29A3" /LENGTH=412 /DNA_ID=CAMNT_0039027677 /DNA_START=166 /DNA_END=1405 /DNA_ORIENTATION=-